MNKCSKCGTEFEGNFCPRCGNSIYGKKICPKCGAEMDSDVTFCTNCGFFFDQMFEEPGNIAVRIQPDYRQAGSGNNGISDSSDDESHEKPENIDINPQPDYRQAEENNNGMPDSSDDESHEESENTDAGSQPDYQQAESGNNGMPDSSDEGREEPENTDIKSQQDYRQVEEDNNDIHDSSDDESHEEYENTDAGPQPDYRQRGNDNNGMPDSSDNKNHKEPENTDIKPQSDYRQMGSDNRGIHDFSDDESRGKPENADVKSRQDYRQYNGDNNPSPSRKSNLATLYNISRRIPLLMVLFSVLLLIFYALPIAKIPLLGSIGSIYKPEEELNEGALAVFRIFLFIYAAVCVILSAMTVSGYRDLSKRRSGYYAKVSKVNALLYFIAIVFSSVMIGVIRSRDDGIGLLRPGSGPIMILVSSLILFLCSLTGLKLSADLKTEAVNVGKKQYYDGYKSHGRSNPAISRQTVKKVIRTVSVLLIFAVAVSVLYLSVNAVTDKFKVSKVSQIKIGDSASSVTAILGEPDEKNKTTWEYYEKSFLKKVKKIEKQDKELEQKAEAAYSRNDTEEIERLLEKELELAKQLENLKGKYICIDFDKESVSSVMLDINYCIVPEISFIDDKKPKAIKDVKLSENHIMYGTKKSDIALTYHATFKDGSYISAKVPYSAFDGINTATVCGQQRICWTDAISKYNVPLYVAPPNGLEFKTDSDGSCCISDYHGEMKDLIIPSNHNGKSVTKIGDRAFYDCGGLKSIVIPDSVTSIGNSAFSGCSGLTSIKIPDGVTSIGDYAFYNCSGLTSMVIPDSVTSIGDWAFDDCSGLKSIKIGAGVTSIGDYVFCNCGGLKSIVIPDSVTSIGKAVFRNCDNIEKITLPFISNYESCVLEGMFNERTDKWNEIPEKLKEIVVTSGDIGYRAFYNCSRLQSVTIGNGVTSIGNSAFKGCSGLTDITISDSVKRIGDHAFYNCRRLTGLTIGSGVTSIGDDAFEDCDSLKEVHITDMAAWCSIKFADHSLNDKRKLYLNDKPLAGNLVIPDGVTGIGDYVFFDRSELTGVVIPDSVRSIGKYAFSGCDGLTSVTIGTGVKGIGEYAFYGCSGLKEVHITDTATWCSIKFDKEQQDDYYQDYYYSNPLYYAHNLYLNDEPVSGNLVIPDGVTSIGALAFYGCGGLTGVTIPNSLRSIGEYAFYDCGRLKEVHITDMAAWCSIKFDREQRDDCYYSNPLCYAHNLYLNDELVSGDVVIPDGTTNIGEGVFYNYSKSTYSKLTGIVIPDSVKTIGDNAFSGCEGLTSISIGNGVTSIGGGAFRDCSRLEEVYISDMAAWCNIKFDGNPLHYAHNLYLNNKLVTKLIIPDGVTSIGGAAFYEYNRLKSVIIPDSVTSIGNSAFAGCSGLQNVIIGAGVTGIDIGAFAWCSGLKSIVIPDGVINIGNLAFFDCSGLQSVVIPDSVTSIGDTAFDGCSGLTSIVIPDSVTSIGERAFCRCSGLQNVIIGAGVTGIGEGAFDGCCSLIEVYNKSKLNITSGSKGNGSAGYYAQNVYSPASGESKLSTDENGYMVYVDGNDKILVGYTGNKTDLILPSGITEINQNVFQNCSGLTSIVIPDSVTSIGYDAFEGCSGLISVTIGASVTRIGNSAFEGCYHLYEIINNSDLALTIGSYDNGYIAGYARVITDKDGNKTYKDPDNPFELIDTPDGFRFVKEKDKNGKDVYKLIAYLGNEETVTLPLKVSDNGTDHDYDYLIYVMRGVKNVIIPDGVTSIGRYAFSGCSGLTSVVIPDSVTSIGDFAFLDCSGLTSVTIGSGVTDIGGGAFRDCVGLEEVHTTDIAAWCNIRFYYDGNSDSNPLFYAHNLYLHDELVTDLVIPDSVTSIGWRAFAGCSGLQSVVMGSGVTSIGRYAFSGCGGLTNVEISDSVKYISADAFEGCIKLRYNLYNHVKYLGNDKNLYFALISVTNKNVATYDINKRTKIIGEDAFRDCEELKSIVIPDSVTSISYGAFSGCGLTSISIGNGVTSIGQYAFGDCSGLKEVHITDVAAWCNIKFDEYKYSYFSSNPLVYAHNLYLNDKLITNLVIPDSVTSIGDRAFYDCSGLKSIVISDSVTSIGEAAFYNCSGLQSVTIGSGVTSIGDDAFEGCDSLKEVHITDIAAWCNIDSSNNPMYYAHNLYLNDKLITNLVIPDGVTSIGRYAFYYCSGLKSIVISDSVTSIGEDAFSDCSGLKEVYYKGDKTKWSHISNRDDYYLRQATLYYYSKTKPTRVGNFWHYDKNGKPLKWS